MFGKSKNVVEFEAPEIDQLTEMTLEQLFEKAATYGSVYVHGERDEQHPKCYHISIRFDCVPGTEMKASSEFTMQIHDAFIQVINRAQTIVDQYK